MLPSTSLTGALVIAHRLHGHITEHLFEYDDNAFKITVSIGVAEHSQGMTPKDLISSADAGLYRAKKAGKNQVRHSGEVLDPAEGGGAQ